MRWSISLLGNHSIDFSPSVFVHFDSGRYLFNCSEGFQRMISENKIKVQKLKSVFLTRLDWEVSGGVPGLLLFLSDTGCKETRVVGPPNTSHLFAGARSFLKK